MGSAGVSEEFGRLGVVTGREFAREAGFGGGVEGECHGERIAPDVQKQFSRCGYAFTPACDARTLPCGR